MEQSHPEVAAMIADLRDNGPMVLAKYEKKKRSSSQVRILVKARELNCRAFVRVV